MDWGALLTSFGLVFVAELGDKTQLAVLTQTCKYRRPWAVFLGASLALTTVTALGAAGGQAAARFVPPSVLHWVAGAAFIVMGLLVAREAAHEARRAPAVCECADGETAPVLGVADRRALSATFGLLFVAEMGDKTQLAVMNLAAKSPEPWLVFVGGGTALLVVTALGVLGGQGLCRVVPRHMLLRVSAAAFIGMGVLMLGGLL